MPTFLFFFTFHPNRRVRCIPAFTAQAIRIVLALYYFCSS
jgi:hypothetical protein